MSRCLPTQHQIAVTCRRQATLSPLPVSVLIPEKVECLVYDTDCLLDIDMFHFLVALTMTLPSLHTDGSEGPTPSPLNLASLPTGGLNDQHALMMVLIVHLVQVMLSYEAPPQGEQQPPPTLAEHTL